MSSRHAEVAAAIFRQGDSLVSSCYVAGRLVLALMLTSMSGPAGATDAAAIAAEKDARFFLAVCQNALDNLAAVSRLAAEQNWELMADPRFPESKPPWIDGMWRVNHDDRSYTAGIGSDLKGTKYCSVSFAEPGPSRDDFVAIVAKSLRLTALPDVRRLRRATCAVSSSRIFRLRDRYCSSLCSGAVLARP